MVCSSSLPEPELTFDAYPRGFFRFAGLRLQEFQTTQVDREFSSCAETENLFLRRHFTEPRNAVLAVDAWLLKISR